MIGTEQLRTIKAAASLPTVIAQSMPLDRAKDLFVGMCPFHREKTGSFYVWPDHYHCFGCGAHGDAIAWLMHGCGLTFVAAVAYLGGNSTITAKPIRQQKVGERSDEEARNAARAQKLWAEAAPPQGTIVEDYLRVC
jgi:DNA primase